MDIASERPLIPPPSPRLSPRAREFHLAVARSSSRSSRATSSYTFPPPAGQQKTQPEVSGDLFPRAPRPFPSPAPSPPDSPAVARSSSATRFQSNRLPFRSTNDNNLVDNRQKPPDSQFKQLALRAAKAIWSRRSKLGLVGGHIDIFTGKWTHKDAGVGTSIDSFYDYLLKVRTAAGWRDRAPQQQFARASRY